MYPPVEKITPVPTQYHYKATAPPPPPPYHDQDAPLKNPPHPYGPAPRPPPYQGVLVVNNPLPQDGITYYPRNNNEGHWNSGLCDCFDDIPNCCITLWCPCITAGQVAEISDRGTTSCPVHGAIYFILSYCGICCLYSCMYRTRLRKQHNLAESSCGAELGDCLTHIFCEQCALCQEYRELKAGGFDPFLGWEENLQKHASGVRTAAPVFENGMRR